MEQLGLWLAGTTANALLGEGCRYLVQRIGPDKFKQALKKSTIEVANEIESEYPEEAKTLRSWRTRRKLFNALQSPDIDEEIFVSILTESDVPEELARKLFKRVQLRFIKILADEGLANDRVFRGIILKRAKEIGKQQSEIQHQIDRIFEEVSRRYDSLEEKINRLHVLTERILELVKTKERIERVVKPIEGIEWFESYSRDGHSDLIEKISLKIQPKLKLSIDRKEITQHDPYLKKTLIVGPPGSGKTTSLLKLLNRFKCDVMLRVEEPFSLEADVELLIERVPPNKDVLLIWDDIHRLLDSGIFLILVSKLTRRSKTLTVLATTRSTELSNLYGFPSRQFWQEFDVIYLKPLDLVQLGEIIEIGSRQFNVELSKELKLLLARKARDADATPLYILSVLIDHKDETIDKLEIRLLPESVLSVWKSYFRGLNPNEKRFLRTVRLLDDARVPPKRRLVSTFFTGVFKGLESKFDETVEELERKCWIGETEDEFVVLDVPLEATSVDFGRYIPSAVVHIKKGDFPRDEHLLLLHRFGRMCSEHKFPREALDLFEEVLKISPQDALAWNNKAATLYLLEEYEEAASSADEALRINPQFSNPWVVKGNIMLERGLINNALKHYERALEMNPTNADAYFNKATALFRKGKYKQALKAYDMALEADPDFTELRRTFSTVHDKAVTLAYLNQLERAAQLFDKAAKIRKGDFRALMNKGIVLSRLKRFDEAIRCFDKAIDVEPLNAESWYNKGAAYTNLNMLEKALPCIDRALQLDEKMVIAWYSKAMLLKKLSRRDEALACYNLALTIDPQHTGSLNDKGNLLVDLGRFEEALELFNKAIKIQPNLEKAWNNKGNALNSLHRYKEGLEALERALRINPKYSKAWHNKGVALAYLGRFGDAISCYENALRFDQNPKSWHQMAKAFASLGQLEDTLVCLDKALRIERDNPEFMIDKALALVQFKRFEEAISCLGIASKSSRHQAMVFLLKGYIFAVQGMHNDAKAAFSEMIRLEPKSERLFTKRGADIDTGISQISQAAKRNFDGAIEALVNLCRADPRRFLDTKSQEKNEKKK